MEANYWLFNMDYRNIEGDIVWQYCINNNCFAMQYQDGKQIKQSITKNLNIAKEVRIGDYCVAYTGEKSIVGVGKVIREFYEEDDVKKGICEKAPYFERIGVEWLIKLDMPLIIDSFTKSLCIHNQVTLSSYTICKVNENGYKYAKSMCEKIIKLKNKNIYKLRLCECDDAELANKTFNENLNDIYWYYEENELKQAVDNELNKRKNDIEG